MASIQKVVSPLTGEVSYRAQVRVKGRSESATFPIKAEAKEWAATIETAIRQGKHFPHAAARRVTFDTLAKSYCENALDDMGDEKAPQRKTRVQQVTWWSDQFKGRPVVEITPEVIKAARTVCAEEKFTRGKERKNKKTGETVPPRQYKRSAATVNRYVAALSAVMTYGIKEHSPPLLTSNPVTSVSRKTEARGRTRFLSDDERARLLDACGKSSWHPLRALVLLAITTGARRSEMTSLHWSDVDLVAGRALVRKSKNHEQRLLILAGEALKALKALEAERAAKPKEERSDYAFPNPSGAPGAIKFFDDNWHAALDAAGIKGFRFHDLRHTTASYLAAQGRSLLEIADVLGHKTLAMVKRYSHLVVDHKADVIAEMIKAKGL
jgi:integrase